jgi:DNA-binding Lrp family transcriptional regulator
LDDVVLHLREIPEVLEVHGTSGQGDLHCRVVARTNRDLQRIINRILEVRGIDRSTTVIALSEQIPYRVLPLVVSAPLGQTAQDA